MRQVASAALDDLRQVLLFWLSSTGVAALATTILPFAGYSTFGDRPGPGWTGSPSLPSWGAVRELAGYALALPVFGAASVAIYFIVPYAVVRLLERGRAPRGVVRVAGALFCGAVAAVAIGGAGWYIALGAVAGGVGVLGGLLYGACVLPRPTKAPDRGEPGVQARESRVLRR